MADALHWELRQPAWCAPRGRPHDAFSELSSGLRTPSVPASAPLRPWRVVVQAAARARCLARPAAPPSQPPPCHGSVAHACAVALEQLPRVLVSCGAWGVLERAVYGRLGAHWPGAWCPARPCQQALSGVCRGGYGSGERLKAQAALSCLASTAGARQAGALRGQ